MVWNIWRIAAVLSAIPKAPGDHPLRQAKEDFLDALLSPSVLAHVKAMMIYSSGQEDEPTREFLQKLEEAGKKIPIAIPWLHWD